MCCGRQGQAKSSLLQRAFVFYGENPSEKIHPEWKMGQGGRTRSCINDPRDQPENKRTEQDVLLTI